MTKKKKKTDTKGKTTELTVIQRPVRTEEEAAPVPAEIPVVAGPLVEVGDPYRGIAQQPFLPDVVDKLLEPIDPENVEIRPDGIIYYPEIFYRRRLNQAFGPGGWALMPRGEFKAIGDTLTRCYALFVAGRFISEVVGEMDLIRANDQMTWATVAEGVKSNALMRTCKDIGIASECWDPSFIDQWKKEHAVMVWRQSKTKPQWRRNDRDPWYDETQRGRQSEEEYTGQRDLGKLKEQSDKLKQQPKQEQQKKEPSTGKKVVYTQDHPLSPTLTETQAALREEIIAYANKWQTDIGPEEILVELTKGSQEYPAGIRKAHLINERVGKIALAKIRAAEVDAKKKLATLQKKEKK
jgi:hypothetical protein